MSKAPIESRIPTFNSRIPIPGKLRNTFIVDSDTKFHTTIVAPRSEKQLMQEHVGRKVCVGNEQLGVLRFVGDVRFNAGVWCGIELEQPVGKHDGLVKGVRYFTCRAGCGIMAPVSKVTLQCDNKISSNKDCDTICNMMTDNQMEDSGPFSLIEVESKCPDALTINTDLNQTTVLCHKKRLSAEISSNKSVYITDCHPATDKTFRIEIEGSKQTESDYKNSPELDQTFSLSSNVRNPVDSINQDFKASEQVIGISKFVNKSETMLIDDVNSILISPCNNNITKISARTPFSENSGSLQMESTTSDDNTLNLCASEDSTLTASNLQTSSSENPSSTTQNPAEIVEQKALNKTNSLCCNKRHSVEISSNRTTFNADCGAANLANISVLPPTDTAYWALIGSSTPKSKTIVKVKTSEQTETIHNNSSDLDKTITLSSPMRSPVVTPSLTKQNSFECDESLGILTPDQMIDFSNFVNNSKTASTDDLKSILIPRRNDLTIITSRTPSSENLGSQKESSTSVTPVDTVQSTRAVDESSLAILTPEQMTDFSVFASEDMKMMLRSKRSDTTLSNSRTPSSENLGSLAHDGFKISQDRIAIVEPKNEIIVAATRPQSIDLRPIAEVSTNNMKLSEMSSPNAIENSIIDFSLGLIEEDMLATGNQFSSLIDTTTNLELPLDSVSGDCKLAEFKSLSRSDQTPSPEDLPLDPIDPIKPVELEIIEPNTKSSSDPALDLEGSSKSTTNTKTNSFITSVTSITSLDTGYQGDGEMSRPASRGADHSPMAHKPNNPALVNLQWQRAITRRQDPMTDSDFFTESDADVHEENAPRGDRKAQVIDGTLYGVNAQAEAAAQDIFIANQEEMDSSGIFTDLDMNPRGDDLSDGERNRMEIVTEDKSPSDISTKTISENSQEIKEPELMNSTLILAKCDKPMIIENISEKQLKSPIQSVTSTASRKSSRSRTPLSKDENPSKKLKMPKRDVISKVKSMMEQKQNEIENKENRKITARKPVGRWDAVMNKISKGQEEDKTKIRLKEVKSKISTRINETVNLPEKRNENRKLNAADSSSTKLKTRRVRARGDVLAATKPNSRTTSSVHSSLSDLSVGLSSSSKQAPPHSGINRVIKKRDTTVGRCPTPVTEVLTANGHKPTPVTSPRTTTTAAQKTNRDSKKNPTLPTTNVTDGKTISGRRPLSRRAVGAVPAHKTTTANTTINKDQSRVTGVPPQKGGSPVRNQILQEKTQAANLLPHVKHSAKGVEALGVLVQYLVFNLDAFRTPSLKHEVETIRTQWIKDKLDLEETRMGYRRLEDAVSEQKTLAAQTLEEERVKYRSEIAELFEKHRRDIAELSEKNLKEKIEIQRRFEEDNAELKNQLDAEISSKEHEIGIRIEAYVSEHRYRLHELEHENEKLRRDHQIALEILREENDSIREQLDDKLNMIEDLKELGFVNQKLKTESVNKERIFDEKLIIAHDEIAVLKEENKKILETFRSDTKDNKLQNGSPEKSYVVPQAALGRCTQLQDEVESLRTVLDLKLAELSELRRAHGELTQAAEELPAALLRSQSLQARVEDLELQLERKTEIELQLTKENKRLQESFNQESKQNKRLSLHNEELQWKLKQNSEVVNAILQGQNPIRKSLHGSNQSLSDDTSYKSPSGGHLSRTHHTSSFNEKHHGTPHMLERTLSFRERTSHFRNSENPNECFSSTIKSDYFELENSPPSSPKVKGVVEKSDSVSWVLDMDESPEVIASRMVRRAGSFRNVTPPKSTPTKSPATKRPRTKSNALSLSASAGAIVSPDKADNRYRSKSVTLREQNSRSPEIGHPGEYLATSWHYSLRTSTPKSGLEPIRSGTKLENNPDLEHDANITIPTLPSEIPRKKAEKPDSLPSLPSGDLLLLQSSFPPKIAAGEAMISESNSEDECSSSTSEHSPSVSDTETSGSGVDADEKCLPKHSKMQYDLFLLTESTNSEAMDCSWSDELDVV